MSFVTEFCVIFVSFLILLVIKIVNNNPRPVLGVYQRPNGFYWLKYFFMFVLLSGWQFFAKLKRKNVKKQKEHEAALEKAQELSAHPNAIDAVYFNGANSSGDYLVAGTARRKQNLLDGFMYLLIESSGLGLLETPKLPGTSMYKDNDSEEFGAEGLKILPVSPMKRWLLLYEGKMKRFEDRGDVFDVKIECVWESEQPYFNFDSDMDPSSMAESMAFEVFTREYFESLKTNHQTHYEQHGRMMGIVTINNKEYELEVDALRDHSFGEKREWRSFHRYGLHFFTCENGDRFNVGKISLPISFSRLTMGYVYCAEDKKIHPVQSCDLELYQHGENGEPPKDYAFRFQAGGKDYTVKVNVLHSPHFYISEDWESKIFERLSVFEVNGKKGWGAAEWQYRNIQGKNVDDYSETCNY